MNKLKFLLAASIATVLTLSCGNHDTNDDNALSSSSPGISSPGGTIGDGNSSSSGGDPTQNPTNPTNPNVSSSSGGDPAQNPNNPSVSSSSAGTNPGTSSAGGNVNLSATSITTNYILTKKSARKVSYADAEPVYSCTTGGVLKQDTLTVNDFIYSINNNTLTWSRELPSYDDDSLHFNGASNNLIGTWTRTKDKNSSCKERRAQWCSEANAICVEEVNMECVNYEVDYDDPNFFDCVLNYCPIGNTCKTNDVVEACGLECTMWRTQCNDYEYNCLKYETEDPYYTCKNGYDITKAVITENTISITRDVCNTDEIKNGEEYFFGWRERVVDCDTYEIYKENDIITMKESENGQEISYKGKSCKASYNYDNPFKSQTKVAAACSQAWNNRKDEDLWIQDFYDTVYDDLDKEWDRVSASYQACVKTLNLPAELMGNDYAEKVAAKSLVKAKTKANIEAKAKVKAKAKFKPSLKKLR